MDIYKRIAAISGDEDYDDMLEELMDRFGEPPKAVQNLLLVAKLKAEAHQLYITDLVQRENEIRFMMYEKAKIDASKIDGLLKYYRGRLRFTARSKEQPFFIYTKPLKAGKDEEDILELIGELLAAMKTLKKE
jgi:transcription-repair coupling factor (superfamily II helicase)